MRLPSMRVQAKQRAGFTLIEAAITIALVGLVLSTTLQILEGSKLSAAHTSDQKAARSLALMTLGEIESGQMWDELQEEGVLSGSYAEVDYEGFFWELAVGEQTFSDMDEQDPDAPFDNWAYRRQLDEEREYESELSEEEEEETEPFQKVRVRVIFPKYGELNNELTLERWIPWSQVYEPEIEEDQSTTSSDPESDGSAGDADAGASGGSDR